MLYTSYFSSKKYDINKSISIALWTPSWYLEKVVDSIYYSLQPSKFLVTEFKVGNLSQEDYACYYFAILENLRKVTPEKVCKDLKDGMVMLCYEKSNEFCHRHLVRKWLNEAGFECEEIK